MIKCMRALMLAALVAAPAMAESSFSGPYVGVGFKTGFLKTSGSASNILSDSSSYYTIGKDGPSTSDQSKTALAGDLLAGCGWDMDDFFVGAEIFGSFGNANQSQVFNTSDVSGTGYSVAGTFSVGTRLGVTARVGYVFTESILGYIGLGVQVARINTTWSDNFIVSGSTKTGSSGKTAFLFAPTVGVEGALMQNVSARLEYTFLKYPTQTATAGSGSSTSTLTNNPKEHQIRLALIYRF